MKQNQMQQELVRVRPALQFAQHLSGREKMVYSLKHDGVEAAGSERTAYRRIKILKKLGLAKYKRGHFEIKRNVIAQPLHIFEKLFPSIVALSQARRFGRSYNDIDIKFALKYIKKEKIMTTLDYAAWKLTKFQTPSDLFIYVKDIDSVVKFLKKRGFSEGKRGHVILLPPLGEFKNEIERVYLDSIANGGRSVNDAIAIALRHKDQISIKEKFFPLEYFKKVQSDLPLPSR